MRQKREKFSFDGHTYIFDRYSADGKYKFWRCVKKNKSCLARIHTTVETNKVSFILLCLHFGMYIKLSTKYK